MSSELKKSESLRKMSRRYVHHQHAVSNESPPPPPPQPPPPEPPISKFKSKSYLINAKTGGSGPSSNDSITSSLNLKRLLFSSSTNHPVHHQHTISGVKTKKLASNVNLLQSNFQTCFLNTAASGKKKRSSLFNLFSFKSNSTTTPAVDQTPRHTSASPSPPPSPYQSYEASIRDSIAMIEATTDEFDERTVYNPSSTFINQVTK